MKDVEVIKARPTISTVTDFATLNNVGCSSIILSKSLPTLMAFCLNSLETIGSRAFARSFSS